MNNSKDNALAEKNLDKKKAKCWAIRWTVFYLILFPIFFYTALLSFMVFDGPRITMPIGLSIIFTWFWTPLSMLATTFLIWLSYFREQYKKTRLYCAVPFITFGAFVLVNAIIDVLFL
jgi:hypothetical protein